MSEIDNSGKIDHPKNAGNFQLEWASDAVA